MPECYESGLEIRVYFDFVMPNPFIYYTVSLLTQVDLLTFTSLPSVVE